MNRKSVTDLGLVLGLQYTTVRDLPNDHFLDQMITLWLDKSDNVQSKGEPSWRSLVRGLRHKQVRQNGIANSIAEDHCITGVQSPGMLRALPLCIYNCHRRSQSAQPIVHAPFYVHLGVGRMCG